jgi:short-subunit dehydrogenase
MALASRGCHVVLHGRREDALHALARRINDTHGTLTRVIPADLTDRAATSQLLSLTDELDIGLFIASAGFGSSGPFIDADRAEEVAMVDVNCGAVVEMSHHFSRRMVNRGTGGIVLLSSLVAYQGTPWSATYAATKAFVQSFAEALRMELSGSGVRVIACTPGPVRTPFAQRARMTMGLAENPETIAEETLRKMGRRSTVRPGFVSKFLIGSLSLLPRWGRVRVMNKIMGGMARTTSRISAERTTSSRG